MCPLLRFFFFYCVLNRSVFYRRFYCCCTKEKCAFLMVHITVYYSSNIVISYPAARQSRSSELVKCQSQTVVTELSFHCQSFPQPVGEGVGGGGGRREGEWGKKDSHSNHSKRTKHTFNHNSICSASTTFNTRALKCETLGAIRHYSLLAS